MPVIEAMSVGCPVLAANAAALPELVEGAGVLIDPDDVDDWARQIERVLDDHAVSADLAAAGYRRVGELVGRDPVEPLLAGYRRALGIGE